MIYPLKIHSVTIQRFIRPILLDEALFVSQSTSQNYITIRRICFKNNRIKTYPILSKLNKKLQSKIIRDSVM